MAITDVTQWLQPPPLYGITTLRQYDTLRHVSTHYDVNDITILRHYDITTYYDIMTHHYDITTHYDVNDITTLRHSDTGPSL